MPNFSVDICFKRSSYNDKNKVYWYDRDDDHCIHNDACCWCGKKFKFEVSSLKHVHILKQ
mgnify:CR=1 FL=1